MTHEARVHGKVETDGAAGLIMVFPARYDITQKQIPEGRTRWLFTHLEVKLMDIQKNIDFCNISFSEGMKDFMKSLLMVSLN